MGELFFIADGQKQRGLLFGTVFLSVVCFIFIHIAKNYNYITLNAMMFFVIIAVFCGWSAIYNIIEALLSKIFFYQNGLVVINCFKKRKILISEIKNVKISKYGDNASVVIFKFEMRNGNLFIVDGRNYDDFTVRMREYSDKLKLEWYR